MVLHNELLWETMAFQCLCGLSLSLRYWVKLQGKVLPFLQPASSSFRYEHKCIIKMTETPKVDLKYHVKTRHEQGWARPGDSGTKGKGTCELPAGASVFLPPHLETIRTDMTTERLEEHETLWVTLCTHYGKA